MLPLTTTPRLLRAARAARSSLVVSGRVAHAHTASTSQIRSFTPASVISSRASFVPPQLTRKFGSTLQRRAGNGNGSTDAAPTLVFTPEEYEHVSESDMDSLHEDLEVLCEEYGPSDWEVEYSSGVMTLSLPPHGTYVINKQPPNQQIWISSPASGPSRFDYAPGPGEDEAEGGWVHHRKSEVKLGRLLEDELRGFLAQKGGDQGWQGIRIR